ncbi:MAG: hypothetical protein ABIY55_25710, partial [Kofleriaceae bacterium]
TVKLTVRGKTLSAPLEVRLDPRVKLAPAVVAQQHQLDTGLATLVTRSSQLVMRVQSTLDQLDKLAAPAPIKTEAGALADKLTVLLSGAKSADRDRPKPPTLSAINGALTTLYKMIDVDAAPTRAQLAEAAQAERALTELGKTWGTLEATDLVRLNASLTAAHMPVVRPELAPETRQSAGNEE